MDKPNAKGNAILTNGSVFLNDSKKDEGTRTHQPAPLKWIECGGMIFILLVSSQA